MCVRYFFHISFYTLIIAFRFLYRSHFVLPIIIPTVDFYRAINFYETILGLKLSVFECETEKMACFIEQGEVVGALFYAPSYQPSPDGILIHFNSQDIEDTLSKVLDKGGKIIIPKTKIEAENKGYFAVLEDSEGNHVGIYEK